MMPTRSNSWPFTLNPELNVNSKVERATGYATDILTDRAVEFISRPHHPDLTQGPDGKLSDPSASRNALTAHGKKMAARDTRTTAECLM
jgi:hypothetical protein